MASFSRRTDRIGRRAAQLMEMLEERRLLSLPPIMPVATEDVGFTIGAMAADSQRDLVYVVDSTNNRVLAVDTNLGRTVMSHRVASRAVALAVSLEGDRLFVAEPDAGQVEVFSLPDLQPHTVLSVGVNGYSLAHAAGERLFVADNAKVYNIDAETGESAGSFGSYYMPLLQVSSNGSHLFVMKRYLSSSGGTVDHYSVSGQTQSLSAQYPVPMANAREFAMDEQYGRVYTANGGVYGVGVTDIITDTQVVWPIGAPYGAAVTLHRDSEYVFGASGGPYTGTIRQFDRASGTPLADYVVATGNWTVMPESVEATANDHVLYANAQWTNGGYIYRLGLVGGTSLVVENVPVAWFTMTPESGESPLTVSFDASASEAYTADQTITEFEWDFGDGSTGNGMQVDHLFTAGGTYTITLRVTSSSGQSDEYVRTIEVAQGQAIENESPTAELVALQSWLGQPATVEFRNVIDAPQDLAGLRFSIDWDNDGVFDIESESSTLQIPAEALPFAGRYTIRGQVADEHGAASVYTAELRVAHQITSGIQIEAENFDAGGEGVGYHDLDPADTSENAPADYRGEGVDLVSKSDGGIVVNKIQPGEWLNYTIGGTGGKYKLALRVACEGQGGKLRMMLDGKRIGGAMRIPDTGGWDNWRTISRTLMLTPGVHDLRIVFTKSGRSGEVGAVDYLKLHEFPAKGRLVKEKLTKKAEKIEVLQKLPPVLTGTLRCGTTFCFSSRSTLSELLQPDRVILS